MQTELNKEVSTPEATPLAPLYVALLHELMRDRQGSLVTTSLTLIDIHDIARSSRTYGASAFFIAHPSPALLKLARTVKSHWQEGFGATYNPKRKSAIEGVELTTSLDEIIHRITEQHDTPPLIVATSAFQGGDRLSYPALKQQRQTDTNRPILLLFGTGWGMSEELLARAQQILEPINGPGPYNHLSVRSACAIILDRLCGR